MAKEISITYLKEIVKEELKDYVEGNLSEKNLRETIKAQLDKSGKDMVFKMLGLRFNTWDKKYEVDSYGTFEKMIKGTDFSIKDIGTKVFNEIVKDISYEDVLASITQPNKAHLKKVYKENLMHYFEEEVKSLAEQHGREYAQKLFEQYIKEDDNKV